MIANEEYKLFWLVVQAERAVGKFRSKELLEYGLSREEAAVLFVAQAAGRKATPAEISRWTLRKAHSISALLIRMEMKGLIRKNKDLEKKNQVRVVLTKKGREAYAKSSKRSSVYKMLDSFSKTERGQFIKYLKKLRDAALEGIGEKRKPPFPVLK
jgi:DNA-binding MarR family transcriptional regulator